MLRLSMGVIGAGKVGSVLAARLRSAGYPIVGVSGRSEASLLRISTLLPGVAVLQPSEVAAAADVLILAVPDDSLIAVAEELASSGAVRPGQFILHTSGRHGLDALAAVTRLGARPIAFHPAMTFTGTTVDFARGPVFGLTAAPAEHALAEELVEALGGVAMWVAESDRALYHAALAHGANHLVTLVRDCAELLQREVLTASSTGGPTASTVGSASSTSDPMVDSASSTSAERLIGPLLSAALDNALRHGDRALTGPVARGDVGTVRTHLRELDRVDPELADTYRTLARRTAHRAVAGGLLPEHAAAEVRATLEEHR